MDNPYEERIRVEMSYPEGRSAKFEKIKAGVLKKYPGAEVKGRETDRNGSEIMITLASVPKSISQPVGDKTAEAAPSKGKPFEFTATADVHAFVSELIEKHTGN